MISKVFPKISTRGYYDLKTGKTIKNTSYDVYPKIAVHKILQKSEIVIMIHGLRNNKSGALAIYVIAKKRLKSLNYRHDVIGYSYDSNTAGVQYKSTALSALKVGVLIAKKNGKNLSKFILDAKLKNPSLKIRLMGHSLANNSKNKGIIESVHFFGASIPANSMKPDIHGNEFQKIVNKKIINHYSPYDDVLKAAHDENWVESPIGYRGALGTTCSKYIQKQVRPQNHRFVSYAKTIKSFP